MGIMRSGSVQCHVVQRRLVQEFLKVCFLHHSFVKLVFLGDRQL